MRWITFLALLTLVMGSRLTFAQATLARGAVDLGDILKEAGWKGVHVADPEAIISSTGAATYTVPQREAGDETEPSGDWFPYYGLRLEVELADDRPVTLQVTLRPTPADRYPAQISTVVPLSGKGWHSVVLPWKAFPLPQQYGYLLGSMRELSVLPSADDGKPVDVQLRRPQLIHAQAVWLSTVVRGKSVPAGQTAEYAVTVSNCTAQPQAVGLSFERNGFAAMVPTVEPASVQLQPGESRDVTVRVQVPARVPPGGYEIQKMMATANGVSDESSELQFFTASQLKGPSILHTAAAWEEIRNNVKKYDWAQKAQDAYVATGDRWNVPQSANQQHPKLGDWLFATQEENNLMAAGISYQLTGNQDHAQKVRTFLLRLSDPAKGFPVTRRACNQASVQEGHFFQHMAMSYDNTLPSGVYSDADQQQIEQTFRLYLGNDPRTGGQISNWEVSALCGRLYCALVLQDLGAVDRLLYSQGGIVAQLREGVLDDGWWYECSISYNVWCATEFTQASLAVQPWGIDLLRAFPNAYRANDEKPAHAELYGMSQARWGPIYKNSVRVKDMWDALPPMLDHRGMIFGLNDSSAKPIAGPQMDIAYYVFRDPAYVPVIERGGGRDLLYAVPELPKGGRDPSSQSAYADNVGVAVLRSQTDARPAREQIQAVLHYGDHGWFHGHFDRTDLLHLSRYGRSFWHPELIWYGYPSFMYKFYTQTSVSKNMVVVDQKMQEPVASQRKLFYAGKMMQATLVETSARWSNPPYGGMFYSDQPYKTFAEKSLAENRSVPVPENPPEYGKTTDYTEPVRQRRLMVVTDDYVLLADDMKGEKQHTYDSLFQMKTFKGLTAPEKTLARHDNQWTTDPLSSAQFVTDCDWYDVTAPAKGSYEFRWGPGADNEGTVTDINDDGVLKIDLHTLWPPRQQIMIGTPPETHPVNKRLNWSVVADGKPLASGEFGAWVLGKDQIDLPLAGVHQLELRTRVGGGSLSTIFWGNLRVVTASGDEIPLSKLPVKFDNIEQPKEPGTDYRGGPIKIVGEAVSSALPGEPKDKKSDGIATIDLTNIQAARLKAVIGGDFPVGDEMQRRKTVANRVIGTEARFLTVLEPFEGKSMITKAVAESADRIRVELEDGRVQEIEILNLASGDQPIQVVIRELRDGRVVRSESSGGNR